MSELVFPPDIPGWQGFPLTHDTFRYRLIPSSSSQVDASGAISVASSNVEVDFNFSIAAGHRPLNVKVLCLTTAGVRINRGLNQVAIAKLLERTIEGVQNQLFLIGGIQTRNSDINFELNEGWTDIGTIYQLQLIFDINSELTAPFAAYPELTVKFLNPLQFEPLPEPPVV